MKENMKNNKIIIAHKESIFLEFCKTLDIKNIKTNEDIIIGEKCRDTPQWEEENIIVIHWKGIEKTIDFIKSSYILIEKIILADSADILSNSELQKWDIIVPNTFISKNWNTIFLENTVWKDYDLKKFWLILNGICADKKDQSKEFQADIENKWIYNYLTLLKKEELLSKAHVILQIWEEDYTHLIAVSDMSI